MTMNSTSNLASPAQTTPSRPMHEDCFEHRPPLKPSPLAAEPTQLGKPMGSNSEGHENMDEDPYSKPQRTSKGKRYKDYIAENGLKLLKKDRKVNVIKFYH